MTDPTPTPPDTGDGDNRDTIDPSDVVDPDEFPPVDQVG